MSHDQLELPRSSRLIPVPTTASAAKGLTSRYRSPARRGTERLAPKAPSEKESFAFDAKPTSPLAPDQWPGAMPDVDKRKLAPLLKALGGSIPMAPVFVAAEQVRKLLSHREEATRPRQIPRIERFSVTGRS
jgi:hypothetical protein